MPEKTETALGREGEMAEQTGIQSVEVAARVLSALAELTATGTLPNLKTLAEHSGMPAAKAHRYVTSLMRSGLVEREPTNARYRLGAAARQIGIIALQGLDVTHVGIAHLPAIRDRLGYTVALAIWALHGPTIVLVEEVMASITVSTRVGQIMPILSSATGRVFGAWGPRSQTDVLIKRELDASPSSRPAATVKTASEAQSLFETIREQGIASVHGDLNPLISAVAVPVFDFRGALVAAICSLGPSAEFDVNLDGDLSRTMRQAGLEVSRSLGFQTAAAIPALRSTEESKIGSSDGRTARQRKGG